MAALIPNLRTIRTSLPLLSSTRTSKVTKVFSRRMISKFNSQSMTSSGLSKSVTMIWVNNRWCSPDSSARRSFLMIQTVIVRMKSHRKLCMESRICVIIHLVRIALI